MIENELTPEENKIYEDEFEGEFEGEIKYEGEGGKSKSKILKKQYNNYDFFSSGSYGCVMYPKMKCDGFKSSYTTKYISKLTIKDKYSINEYEIGQKLLKLKSSQSNQSNQSNQKYEEILDFINFVERKCSIEKNKVNLNKRKHKCKILYPKYKANEYELFYLKYIPSKDISSYLNENSNKIKIIYRYYSFVLECIKFLKKHNIIHHDLHMANVIVDENENYHLIDFGIAIDLNKCYIDGELNINYIKTILLGYDPSWAFWSIEYHILCHFVYNNEKLSDEIIKEIIETYYKNNIVFKKYFSNLKIYKKKVYDFIKSKYLNNVPIEKHIKSILNNASHTWDLYQLNYLVLDIMELYHIEENESLIDLCKIGIHYDYNARFDVDFYIEKILMILNKNKTEQFISYLNENIKKAPKFYDLTNRTTKSKIEEMRLLL